MREQFEEAEFDESVFSNTGHSVILEIVKVCARVCANVIESDLSNTHEPSDL